MALSQRQLLLYQDTVNLYKPVELSSGRMPNNENKGLRYPSTPTHTGVSCHRHTRTEMGQGRFHGRINKEDTVSLIDSISFDAAQDIDANWVMQITTPSDPDLNAWFIVSNTPEVKNYRANKKRVQIKRITKPAGVA